MSEITDLEKEVKADAKEVQEANSTKPWFKRLSLTAWNFVELILGVVVG